MATKALVLISRYFHHISHRLAAMCKHICNGKGEENRYECVIECLQTSAVHSEVAFNPNRSDLVVDIMGLIDRRGNGKANHSDSRSNFIRQNSEFQDIRVSGTQISLIMLLHPEDYDSI